MNNVTRISQKTTKSYWGAIEGGVWFRLLTNIRLRVRLGYGVDFLTKWGVSNGGIGDCMNESISVAYWSLAVDR